MAIWKYINEHDNGVTNFHFEISADLLREEELQEMSTMRPGLIQLRSEYSQQIRTRLRQFTELWILKN